MKQHLVFVYGTLRGGGAGAMSTRFPEAKFIAEAKVSGSLYDLGAHPGLLLDESSPQVAGEVYEVDDETLNALDAFEASSHYRRRGVEISLGAHRRACWVYEPDPEFYSLSTLITSGDWVEHAKTKTERLRAAPSLARSVLTGGLGFGLVSLCVFATVAFAERWMYARLGLLGAYLVWTALFILLGGAAVGSLAAGRWRLPRFYVLFGAAFFAYAAGWVGAYFVLRGAAGEWVGSLAGSLLMGLIFAVGFGVARSALSFAAVLFAANSVGYFLGSALNEGLGGPAGMLLWGGVYGLCLGAGLGAVLYSAQSRRAGGDG
jgi:gamma-glutamylcyclotransferase (GGCT)/AIG2-like uncharacterized protein YtfP